MRVNRAMGLKDEEAKVEIKSESEDDEDEL